MENEELARRLLAVELDLELLKVAILKNYTLEQLEQPVVTATGTELPQPLKLTKPILVNKSWANLVNRCRDAEKRGKVDEVAYDAIHGSNPDSGV